MLGPLLVLAVGVGAVVFLKSTAPEPSRAEPGPPGELVEVTAAERFRGRPTVSVHGQVRPAREARVAPEVSGRVAWVADALVAGGRFEAGEPMLRVDDTDYRLALAAQRGQLSEARLALERQRSEQTVARQAWELFDSSETAPTERGRELALQRPQLEAAEAQLGSARSRLSQARQNLARTTLTAPFDATVREHSVEVGQQVSPQTQVASLVGTDAYHVEVSIPVDALPSLRFGTVSGTAGEEDGASGPQAGDLAPQASDPGSDAREPSPTAASPALVSTTIQGRRRTWRAHLGPLLPAVDERGSMARALVVVPDPLGLESPGGPRETPLLIGSFVEVQIEAEPLDDVVRMPRAALREGGQVWVATEDGRLDVREVSIAWRRADSVLVSSGLRPGEQVVVSPLPAPVDGMRVRLARADEQAVADGGASDRREAALAEGSR